MDINGFVPSGISFIFSKRSILVRHEERKLLGVTFGTGRIPHAYLHKADNKEILSNFFVLLHIFLRRHHPVVSEQVKAQCCGEINVSYKHVTMAPDSAQCLELKGLETCMVFLILRFCTLVSASF